MRKNRKAKMYRNLRRTERALWIALLVCLYMLFVLGIDIEYYYVDTVSTRVLHTITVVASIVLSMTQYAVITRAKELEEAFF